MLQPYKFFRFLQANAKTISFLSMACHHLFLVGGSCSYSFSMWAKNQNISWIFFHKIINIFHHHLQEFVQDNFRSCVRFFPGIEQQDLFYLCASSICSGAPLSFICVPRLRIFNRGNFFFKMSSFPLFTPKNSIGFTVSRLIIVSVNTIRFNVIKTISIEC